MTADLRAMRGLGYPPIKYNQNANNAINSAFKRGLHKNLSTTDCVDRIERFVHLQQEQTRFALIGMDELRVLPT